MAKRTVPRHQFKHSGWNASNDPEWRYRKTLDKKERDVFDALSDLEQTLCVSEWCKAGEPREHNIKAEVMTAKEEAGLATLLGEGMIK